MKISGARVPKVHFLVWRDHCGRHVSCHLKGEPTYTSHKEGEAGILGPHGDHVGHHPSRGMLGLKEAIFDAGNHFKGKDEDLKHTQKHVNVLSATKISKKPGVWMS